MRVPVLKHGVNLIAMVQSSSTDADLVRLRGELAEMVGRFRARGVILEVSALDVIDSFAVRMLRGIAQIARLRGANAVIVGIQPEVAFAMVQLGLNLEDVPTALDLDDGLTLLGLAAREIGTSDR